MISADVVIVGGGIQGLVLPDELTRQGYDCLLVTKSDLGTGQTLHSHGLLNSGTGVLTGQLREPVEQALSFARDRGLDLYCTDQWYALLPPPAFERLSRLGDASGYRYLETSPSSLPAGFEVGDGDTRVVALEGYNFPKRQLVWQLAAGHEHQIIRGDIATVQRSHRDGLVNVDSVDISVAATGATVPIALSALVAATGTGTKRLVRSIVAGRRHNSTASRTRACT